ncbi:hypothetical protein CENSYa_1418 [Cenarchaeum symbiosum A]|uniref:Uncharacterized protein n=1 Tax=Cenarchaeum symbiosum (strain A) TaxID=414004 RepID=A0RXH3_CENSY|nr:hypothetical protein CENSYa_1418 [Cenarchaeum symbiosum A]
MCPSAGGAAFYWNAGTCKEGHPRRPDRLDYWDVYRGARILFGVLVVALLIPSFFGTAVAQSDTSQNEQELINELRQIRESLDRIDDGSFRNFVVSMGIVSIAIIATVYTGWQLNKQLRVAKREVRHRVRPIMVQSRTKDERPYRIEQHPTFSELMMKITNAGPLPAVNIKSSIGGGIIKNGEQSVINQKLSQRKNGSLGPGEHIHYVLRLSLEDHKEVYCGNMYHFELNITYESPDEGEEYYYLFRGHFEKSGLIVDVKDMN